jgi:hypothetical protein
MKDSENGWSKEVKNKIQKQKRESLSYKLMHEDASSLFNKYDRVFSIISISLATLTATGSLGSETFNDSVIYRVMVAIILYLIAFLTAINGYFNWARVSEKHKIYSLKFLWLHNQIYNELSLKINDRDDGYYYMNWVDDEFDNYLSENPTIPSKIRIKVYKDNPILEQDTRDLFEVVSSRASSEDNDVPKVNEENEVNEVNEESRNVKFQIQTINPRGVKATSSVKSVRHQYEMNRLTNQ